MPFPMPGPHASPGHGAPGSRSWCRPWSPRVDCFRASWTDRCLAALDGEPREAHEAIERAPAIHEDVRPVSEEDER